jgi:PAS domain S-box-containing protein
MDFKGKKIPSFFRLTPLKIAGIYALISAIWILLSDRFISMISDDPKTITQLQSYKGIVFISLSAVLIYLLSRKSLKQSLDAEKALSESEDRYRKIFNAPSDAIFIHDAGTGRVIDVNYATLKMFGYSSKEEILSEKPENLVLNQNKATIEEALKRIKKAASGKPQQFEWLSKRKDNTTFSVEVTLKSIIIDDHKCVVAVVRDITERKLAEEERVRLTEQLHQSHKMDALGQLAGGVAHDFNNMLNGIMGAAELIRLKQDDTDSIDEYVDLIIKSAEKAGNLTKQLLTFSRKAKKSSSDIDVGLIVNETVSLLKRTINKAVEIKVEKLAEKTNIVGDDYLIQNCLINMGINAEHAMPGGGVLTFTFENVFLDKNYCSLSPFNLYPGEYLKISVSDTGEGMPPEVLKHIFEPFFTTKEQGKGTGLGLAAVHGTIYEHNGAITVYSEENKGSVFHIFLPVSENKIFEKKNSRILARGSGTVLLIDDEELIRKVGKSQLKQLGYDVITAENGQKALEILKEDKERIDIVILDMIMPVMGGRETFIKIREFDKSVPVLISSGFSREDDLEEMKKQGLNGFLHKPFLLDQLASRLSDALKKNSKP